MTHREASEVQGPKFEQRVYKMLLADSRFNKVRVATRTEQREGHIDIVAETLYTRTNNNDIYPMIRERVITGGIEVETQTRGDRLVYFTMAEVEKLSGAYTA